MIGTVRVIPTAIDYRLTEVNADSIDEIKEELSKYGLSDNIRIGQAIVFDYLDDQLMSVQRHDSIKEALNYFSIVSVTPCNDTTPKLCVTCIHSDSLGQCNLNVENDSPSFVCKEWKAYQRKIE